jgi:hypothetical protein
MPGRMTFDSARDRGVVIGREGRITAGQRTQRFRRPSAEVVAMSFPVAISFAVSTLMAAMSAGLAAPLPESPPGLADVTMASSPGTRLEVWASPSRITTIERGRSRAISAAAVETMAEWRKVNAVITARTTAGRITPTRSTANNRHPATFRLTRTSGSAYGFVTLTATARGYGTATRVVSWGRVGLPRTLTGTLVHVNHWVDNENQLISDDREEWNVTFRLVSRSSTALMGAALYRLTDGTWSASTNFSSPNAPCVGQGAGRAAAGTLRYDWRGTAVSTGAGAYWIEVSSTEGYGVECVTHEYVRYPGFTGGFPPATGGIDPDHLKGTLTTRVHDDVESHAWELSAPGR